MREIAILSERNKEKGAMVLSSEQFRLIYRFLARAELNYHRENKLALFTVTENEGGSCKRGASPDASGCNVAFIKKQ